MPRGFGASLNGVGALYRTFDYVRDQFSGRAEWVVGTSVEYSVYVEFGTSRMAAQPYLRPAVEHAKRNMNSITAGAQSLDDAIMRLAYAIESEAKRLCPVDTGNLRASITAQKVS